MIRWLAQVRPNRYLLMLLVMAVSLLILVIPQQVAAAGETYLWQTSTVNGQTTYQIVGTGGEFEKFEPKVMTFDQETPTSVTYNGNRVASRLPGCGSALQPRYTITVTGTSTGNIATENRGCPGTPNLTGPITIEGAAAPGAGNPPPQNNVNDDWCTYSVEEGKELSYFICPTINFMAGAVTKLDCAILASIKLNTVALFNKGGTEAASPECVLPLGNTPNEASAETSEAYHTVWRAFRTLALILATGIGLFITFATILGWEIVANVRKVVLHFVVALVFMVLTWDIYEFLYLAANASADAVMDIIKIPFQNLDYTTGGVGFRELLFNPITTIMLSATTAGVGILALLTFGGVGVVLALVASLLLTIFSVWVLLIMRDVLATLLVLISPIVVICAAYDPLKSVFTFGKTATIGLLLFIPGGAFILAVSQGAALIAAINGHTVVAGVTVIGGFIFFWTLVIKLDKLTGALGNAVSSLTSRAQKALSDYRSRTYKNRARVWKQGGLFNDSTPFGRGMNSLGLRYGSSQARVASTGRGTIAGFMNNEAVTKYADVVTSQKEEDKLMQAMGKDDDPLAALAGATGESRAELLDSAQRAGMTGERAERAADRALAIGADWNTRAAALRLLGKTKARAVSAGNVEFIATAARNLSRGNASLEASLAQDFAYHARSNGRADLGGTIFDGSGAGSMVNGRIDMSRHYAGENESYRNARNAYQVAINNGQTADQARQVAWQVIRDANVEDGFTRLPPGAFDGSHDAAIIQASETYSRILSSDTATDLQRFHAAMGLKEMHSSRMGMSGTARDAFNTALQSLSSTNGERFDFSKSIDDELVRLVRDRGTAAVAGLTGEQLSRQARAYRDISYGAQMMPDPNGGPPIPIGPPVGSQQQQVQVSQQQQGVPGLTWTPGSPPVVVNPPVQVTQQQQPGTQAPPPTKLWVPGSPPPGQPPPQVYLPTGPSTYTLFQPAQPQVGGKTQPPASVIELVQAQRIEPGQTQPRPHAAGQGGGSNREGRTTYNSTATNPTPAPGTVGTLPRYNAPGSTSPGATGPSGPIGPGTGTTSGWESTPGNPNQYKNLPPP